MFREIDRNRPFIRGVTVSGGECSLYLPFVQELFERSGVLTTPGSAFGPSGEGYVRMALVQDEEAIECALAAVDACGILKGR